MGSGGAAGRRPTPRVLALGHRHRHAPTLDCSGGRRSESAARPPLPSVRRGNAYSGRSLRRARLRLIRTRSRSGRLATHTSTSSACQSARRPALDSDGGKAVRDGKVVPRFSASISDKTPASTSLAASAVGAGGGGWSARKAATCRHDQARSRPPTTTRPGKPFLPDQLVARVVADLEAPGDLAAGD